MIEAGQYVTDGTAVFLVCDIRDGAQVGDIKMSPVLRKGYVKANGALLTSARANYPRLVTFVQENPSLKATNDTAWNENKALYVYDDTNDTLRVPDATGRVLQGGASVQSVEAGLPNISGEAAICPSDNSTATKNATSVIRLTQGALSKGNTYTRESYSSVPAAHTTGELLALDASLSNPIYSASTTVQPPALSLIPQIKY